MSHPRAFVRRSRFRRSLAAAALVLLCVFPDASPPAQTVTAGQPAASSQTRRRVARRRTRRRPAARRANTSAPAATQKAPGDTIIDPIDPDATPGTQPPPAAPGASFGERPKKSIVSGGVLNGKAISKPSPPYPAIARAARAQGTVTVQIVVDEEGKVISASPVSGHPLLQQAAVNAARGARFAPTFLDGKPVRVSGVITYNFVLQ
jgi:TonB family protein